MLKTIFFFTTLFFLTELFAERGEVIVVCETKGAIIYVDGQRKTRIVKAQTSLKIEEGKHIIKVVEELTSKCQRYVTQEVSVIAKGLVNVHLILGQENEPIRYRKVFTKKDTKENRRFERTACEVVVDRKEGLMWQDNKVKNRPRTLKKAKKYCQELKLSIFDDWRLPSYKELLSIVDYNRYNPACISQFENGFSGKYWSVSQDVAAPEYAWFVGFNYGKTGVSKKDKAHYVRCVRNK